MAGTSKTLQLPQPLALDGGGELARPVLAYETYGELAEDKSNAILLCHALTGDQYVASTHPVTGCWLATYWSPVSAWHSRIALERSAFSSP